MTTGYLYQMVEASLLSTLTAKVWSCDSTANPPGSRRAASPVLGGSRVGWEEDVLDDTGVLLPVTAALT